LAEIVFKGDAPIIASDAFAADNPWVYYPSNNTTWTYEKIDGYGEKEEVTLDYFN